MQAGRKKRSAAPAILTLCSTINGLLGGIRDDRSWASFLSSSVFLLNAVNLFADNPSIRPATDKGCRNSPPYDLWAFSQAKACCIRTCEVLFRYGFGGVPQTQFLVSLCLRERAHRRITMRSFFNTNVNVVTSDRTDRMNVTGMQLQSVLLGRLRLYLRAISSSLRHEHCRRSKHGIGSHAAAITAAMGPALWCPWQPRLLAFACTT